MPPRLTEPTCRVLVALARAEGSWTYGLQLARDAGLAGGTVYPILSRLEGAGWVESEWEQLDESAAGRRRRRYYRLSGTGADTAAVAARRLVDRTPSWQPASAIPTW